MKKIKNKDMYVFNGEIPMTIEDIDNIKPCYLFESQTIHASQEAFEKFEKLKDHCLSDPWGYGVEVWTTLDLFEMSMKHNAYTCGYYFELLYVEPIVYEEDVDRVGWSGMSIGQGRNFLLSVSN